MKTKVFIISILLISSVAGFSQTSWEEYNYITNGLKTSIEQGLDLKKGYYFSDMQSFNYGNKKIELYKFKRTKNKTTACIVIKTMWNGGKNFYCLPTQQSEQTLINEAYNKIYTLSRETNTAIIFALNQYN
ncbi:MAG: hypothetical protein QM751_06240 [Paludibacteraceae bacterium]